MQDHYPERNPPFTTRIQIATPVVTVSGLYNSNPALNTQVVSVPITAAQLAGVDFGKYRHGLRRTDSGHYTEVTVGDCFVEIGP